MSLSEDAANHDSAPGEPRPAMVPARVLDVVVDLPASNPMVVLAEEGGAGRWLRFPVGWAEGQALAYALRNIASQRPLTHELFLSAMAAFGVSLEVVRITGRNGKTLLAEVVLSGPGGQRQLDCRPSDAVILATRASLEVPIVVSVGLLDELGEPAPGVPGEN